MFETTTQLSIICLNSSEFLQTEDSRGFKVVVDSPQKTCLDWNPHFVSSRPRSRRKLICGAEHHLARPLGNLILWKKLIVCGASLLGYPAGSSGVLITYFWWLFNCGTCRNMTGSFNRRSMLVIGDHHHHHRCWIMLDESSNYSMDWFRGKTTGNTPCFMEKMEKSMASYRVSLAPPQPTAPIPAPKSSKACSKTCRGVFYIGGIVLSN